MRKRTNITPVESPVKEYLIETSKDKAREDKVRQDMNDNSWIMNNKSKLSIGNQLFYNGEQYSPREERALRKRGQEPLILNETERLVDNILGMHSKIMTDTVCVGRNHNNDMACSFLNYIIKWIEQINNIKNVENAVFKDGIIKGAGWVEMYWDRFNGRWGYPCIKKVQKEEIFHGAFTEPDASDADFIARLQYVRRVTLQSMFPDYSKDIKNASYGDLSFLHEYINKFHLWQYWDYMGLGQNPMENIRLKKDQDLLPFIKHYEKVAVYKYLVVNDVTNVPTDQERYFDTEAEAMDYFRGVWDGYTEEGKNLYTIDGETMVKVEKVTDTRVIQTLMIGDRLISSDMMILDEYPFIPYFPKFSDGSYTAPMNVLKDYNRGLNNAYSMFDLIMGSATKNLLLVNRHNLDMTPEELRRQTSNPNGLLFVKSLEQTIKQFANNPVSPDYFKEMQYYVARMNEIWGGKELLGVQESAAASAKAASQRASQGGLQRIPMFEAMNEFRRTLAYRMVWWIKYMDNTQLMKIISTSDDVQFIDFKPEGLQSVKELEYDIQTTESNHSETMQQARVESYNQLLQNYPAQRDAIFPMIVQDSPLTAEQKSKLLETSEVAKVVHQQKTEQQHQQKLIQQATDQRTKKLIKEREEEAEKLQDQQSELDKAKNKLSGSINDLALSNAKVQQMMQPTP